MSVRLLATRVRRALSKPPSYVLKRVRTEIGHALSGFTQPAFGRRFSARQLLQRTNASDLTELWGRMQANASRIFPHLPSRNAIDSLVAGESDRILEAAARALENRIDLLGSGPVQLGHSIDWHRDYKSGDRWPDGYFRRIDYLNVGRPSDVKTVWELSRMQWLIPCAQAFVLTGHEKYARHVREVIEQWVAANPYACGVNWGVTMEPALRIVSWTWMLRACGSSEAFSDHDFRYRFMRALFLHGLFTERYFERSDVNGNHFTADAAGLIFAGALFGHGADAKRWLDTGQADIEHEVGLQVHPDGVDFEASAAYHRLVAELFLISSIALQAAGRELMPLLAERLAGMARFTAAYSRPDGLAPLWGDNDDARALPFGSQRLRDHRYLVGLVGLHLRNVDLISISRGSRAEAAWMFGCEAASALPECGRQVASCGFPDGGVYVMRDDRNHVFIDCGPVGLAGRGGHGHNDLLSFEAVLAGVPLVTEGGCFVYTADEVSRDIDRSTRSHNTPMVDGQEVNRFIGPEFRWNVHNDARHELVEFSVTPERDCFVGRHYGFHRIADPLTVERRIELLHESCEFVVSDRFLGTGVHEIRVPLHLASGARVVASGDGRVCIEAEGRGFEMCWEDRRWSCEIGTGREAYAYGRQRPVTRLEWRAVGADLALEVTIRPLEYSST
jgi:hypothetical protein